MGWVDRSWQLTAKLLVAMVVVGLFAILLWAYLKVMGLTIFLPYVVSAFSTVIWVGLSSVPLAVLLSLTVIWQDSSLYRNLLYQTLSYLGNLPVFLWAYLFFLMGFTTYGILPLAFALPLSAYLSEILLEYPLWYIEVSYAYGAKRHQFLGLLFRLKKLCLLQILLRHFTRIAGEFLVLLFFLENGLNFATLSLVSSWQTIYPWLAAYLQVAFVFSLLQLPFKFWQNSFLPRYPTL